MNDKNKMQYDQDQSEQSEDQKMEDIKGGQSEATIDQNQGNTEDVTQVSDLGSEEETAESEKDDGTAL